MAIFPVFPVFPVPWVPCRVPYLPPVENGRSLLPIERGAAHVISKLGVLVHGGQVTRVEQNVEALKDNGTVTVTA